LVDARSGRSFHFQRAYGCYLAGHLLDARSVNATELAELQALLKQRKGGTK